MSPRPLFGGTPTLSRPRWSIENIIERLRGSGYDLTSAVPPIAWFGDDPEQARELADLVRDGRKTATAGLLWKWQADGRAPPQPGDHQIIVDGDGEPRVVIEFTEVTVHPFDEVGPAFAAAEGEGDLSLEYWRDVHWNFFSRECARIGRTPDAKMPTICMRFRVVRRFP